MRSTPEVSSMEVMFSVHEDSVWSVPPPRTFSVGFEEQIVVGVMFFTFTDPKIVVKSLFPILYFKKKNIFSLLHSLAVVEEWKYGVCCFSWYSSSWTCDLSQFFRCFSPRRSAIIIGIHRIMIHTDQIPQSCGDTYIVCVCLVSRYQIDQFYPLSVSLIIFYAGGRYKLLNQWKWVFHVVIPHEFQSRGKITENWWFLMYSSTPDV